MRDWAKLSGRLHSLNNAHSLFDNQPMIDFLKREWAGYKSWNENWDRSWDILWVHPSQELLGPYISIRYIHIHTYATRLTLLTQLLSFWEKRFVFSLKFRIRNSFSTSVISAPPLSPSSHLSLQLRAVHSIRFLYPLQKQKLHYTLKFLRFSFSALTSFEVID